VWGGYFTELDRFQVGTLKVEDEEVRSTDLRLTVDTPEDLVLMKEIFNRLNKSSGMFTLKEVLNFLEKNPNMRAINQNVEQKSPPPIKVDGG
jgi:spore coat polysaccharide biosynthesis protein SpsF (cytidylyltransferase family)